MMAGKLPRETDARLVRDIEEDDGRLLAREAAHDRFSDAGCATGDQHDFAGEIGIDGDHASSNGARVAEGRISAIM